MGNEGITFEEIQGYWDFSDRNNDSDHLSVMTDSDETMVMIDLFYDGEMYPSGNGTYEDGVYNGIYTEMEEPYTEHPISIVFSFASDDTLSFTYEGEPLGSLTLHGGIRSSTQ
jgi:hypothetical protein